MKYLIPLMLTVSILMSDSQLKNHNVNFIPKPGQVYLNNPTREEGILIVDFDQTPMGENLKSTIESIYDGVVDITSDFEEMNLSGREAVFVLLGIFPNNTVILPEGSTPFLDYLNSGGNLYMEGGDMWYYSPPISRWL